MAQNVYDRPEFFTGYSQLGRSLHGLAGAAEWPAIRAMLPDLRDLRVLDLGCGSAGSPAGRGRTARLKSLASTSPRK